MTPIVLGEYRNQHSRRNYPFADDVSMSDVDGQALPVDFLVDAFLYPIDIAGAPYISTIDVNARVVTFSDSSGGVVGSAEILPGSGSASIYEVGRYGRQLGILVFGDGIQELFRGRPIRNFNPGATAMCPTTYIPLNQVGVRGILLPDGTLLTGEVVFEGRDGVAASSYVEPDGRNVLEFGVYGTSPVTPEDCGDECIPIQEVCFQRVPGSRFMISEYAPHTVAITSYGFDLTDICEAQRSIRLPDYAGNLPLRPKTGSDPCVGPPVPPPPINPGPEVEICYRMEDTFGNLFIVTPSAAGFLNAVGLRELDHVGLTENPGLNMPRAVENAAEALRYVESFTDPVSFADGLMLFIRGLRIYRGS